MTTKVKHAKHSPSSLGYKEICPAFRGRSGTNPAAEEGTLMHEALEKDDFSKLNEEQAFLCGLCRDYRDGELAKLTIRPCTASLNSPLQVDSLMVQPTSWRSPGKSAC